ncbi:phage tail assembly protein [Escherichia coli]|nr:phage tail assembly protein [Escherichia coli]
MSQTPSDTFKLSYPFTTAAGTRIELVELKRLTVKDLKQVRKISKNRKRLVRTVLIFTESSDQLSRATDRVPGLPASPGYVQ